MKKMNKPKRSTQKATFKLPKTVIVNGKPEPVTGFSVSNHRSAQPLAFLSKRRFLAHVQNGHFIEVDSIQVNGDSVRLRADKFCIVIPS
jgi:hypothetical protein